MLIPVPTINVEVIRVIFSLLKIVELSSNRNILSEVSKNQSYLFKLFQIPMPMSS